VAGLLAKGSGGLLRGCTGRLRSLGRESLCGFGSLLGERLGWRPLDGVSRRRQGVTRTAQHGGWNTLNTSMATAVALVPRRHRGNNARVAASTSGTVHISFLGGGFR